VLGLDGADLLLRNESGAKARKLRDFMGDARLALARTGGALRATAHPIEIARVEGRGRTWALSADVQAYALGLTISFLALVLAAGSLAAERDENVVGRLARGLVTLGELVWAKVLLAALVALALGLGVSLVFGAIIQIGNVTGGEPWGRLPVLALGLLLAGAALGALGALLGAIAREARTASLVALLVVLPIVFLGLVPVEIVPAAGWISDGLPFIHAVRFFGAALYDTSPWWSLLREALWLVGLGALFGFLARIGTRRLLA
jgi:ABC-2 type transport system permease protein